MDGRLERRKQIVLLSHIRTHDFPVILYVVRVYLSGDSNLYIFGPFYAYGIFNAKLRQLVSLYIHGNLV